MPRALRPAGAIDEAIVSPKKRDTSKPVPEPSPTNTPVPDPFPNVTATTPASDAIDVATTVAPTATFDIALTAGTVTTGNVELRNASNTLVARSVSYNSTARRITITPSSALTASTLYTVNLLVGIQSSAGVALEQTYTWQFTTKAAPNPAPTVASTSPAGGATSVDPTANITVTFDQDMTSGTINTTNLVLKDQAGTAVTRVVTWDAATRTATINPTPTLANSNTHTVNVLTGVQNASGLAMGAQYDFVFTTQAATPAPQITAVAPLAGSVDRAVTVNAKATTDIALDPATVTSSTVTLRNAAGQQIAGAVSYDSALRQVIFDPTVDLAQGTTYTCTLSTGVKSSGGVPLTADYAWSFTTVGATQSLVIVGWAAAATPALTGGDGGTLFEPTDWAGYTAALLGTGLANNAPRIVRPKGTANFSGGGNTSFNVSSDNITLDGSNYTGSFRLYDIQFKNDNVKLTQMRLRAGDQYANPNDQDCLTINPGAGNVMGRLVIDHCSILWALDMGIAILNHVTDLTVQHCIIGCGLRQSTKPDNPKGLGANISVPANNEANEAAEHGERITFYRNFYLHNFERNIKAERASFVEHLNNVLYNWGGQVGHGNPRSINVIQNYYRKGNNTTTSRVWEDDPNYGPYSNSVYFPFAQNVFTNLNGTTFTPTGDHIGTAEERSTPNTSSGLVAATMNRALADQIVAAAGPAVVDSVDQALKDNWTNGTGTFYNGIGNPAPNPTYPAPF